jgi:hypothetical protein
MAFLYIGKNLPNDQWKIACLQLTLAALLTAHDPSVAACRGNVFPKILRSNGWDLCMDFDSPEGLNLH